MTETTVNCRKCGCYMEPKGAMCYDMTVNKPYRSSRFWLKAPTVSVWVRETWICDICGSVAISGISETPLYSSGPKAPVPGFIRSRVPGQWIGHKDSVVPIRWD